MTNKELAKELYRLNVKRGLLNPETGCGEKVWIKRTLKGCGANKGMTKEELIKAINWAKEDL